MASTQQSMEVNMHKLKMMISKKGNCNDVFAVFCQFQHQVREFIKESQYNQKQQQKIKNNYQNQIGGIQKNGSRKQAILQQENKQLRKRLSITQEKLMNSSMNSLQLEMEKIQQKYSKNYQTDEVYKLLKDQILELKKQLKSKNQIIKKLRNSDGYTQTQATGDSNVSSTSKKLRGFNFSKPNPKVNSNFNDDERDNDFDGLDTSSKNN